MYKDKFETWFAILNDTKKLGWLDKRFSLNNVFTLILAIFMWLA